MGLAAYVDPIVRRKCKRIYVGNVPVGGDAPITVQSMTNTLTSDAKATIEQLQRLEEAGMEIGRVSCPDQDSTKALSQIIKAVKVPVVADIHFHYKRAVESAKAGAACLRLNPGNIEKREQVRELVQAAKDYGCSMRIGVNSGSVDRKLLEKYGGFSIDGLVESAMLSVQLLEDMDFTNFKISVKASHPRVMIEAYKRLAAQCDYPLHLGVTEAGGLITGTVKSAVGTGSLLNMGIGDTIRISLSADPVEEIKVGFELLKALSIRSRGVNVVSCPSCARQGFDVISVVSTLEKRLEHIKTPMTLSIIGCVVNGIGEAMNADIGITGGGGGKHLMYYCGRPSKKFDESNFVDEVVAAVEKRAVEIDASGGNTELQ